VPNAIVAYRKNVIVFFNFHHLIVNPIFIVNKICTRIEMKKPPQRSPECGLNEPLLTMSQKGYFYLLEIGYYYMPLTLQQRTINIMSGFWI
jgi:hypothetical protein